MKRKLWKKTLATLLAMLMIATLFPSQFILSAKAYWDNYGQFSNDFTYIYRSWDPVEKRVIKEERTHTGPYSELKMIWERWESPDLLYGVCDGTPSDWYLVSQNVTINERINVVGNVNLVICDGHTVTFKDGIHVPEGSTLNIYGQANDSGKLTAIVDINDSAAIGANDQTDDCGTINIYGGTVIADAMTAGADGAGIGGGDGGNGGNVTIYGGSVEAYGANLGAGIGGGDKEKNSGGNGGTTVIYGGTVTAMGGNQAAGIGGGESGNGGNIKIYGGTVTAKGGENAAGIGGGNHGSSGDESGNGGNIKIYGGTVTAKGGENAAGIGGGDHGSSGDIVINGDTVNINATGGSAHYDGGAGIGGGNDKGADNIVISNCQQITAQGGCDAAGIGGGDHGGGGNITISGGIMQATGGKYGAGIGGGQCNSGGTINIISGTIRANGGKNAAGVGGGDNGSGGTITFYGGGYIEATGGDYGAGVGGGYHGSSGTIETNDNCEVYGYGGIKAAGVGGGDEGGVDKITLNDGNVVGRGGSEYSNGGAGIGGGSEYSDGGAGIGGGNEKSGGIITINGGSIEAYGGCDAAGLGGGDNGEGGTITITKEASVFATGGNYGAGIGGGQGQGGGRIDISTSGEIYVIGGSDGAGIGGGENGNGGTITISGGTITVESPGNGAGIGGGENADGGSITISGGTTTVCTIDGIQSLKGNSITLSDDATAFKGMCVKKPDGSIAPKADRVAWCTSTDNNKLVIAQCEHNDCSYTNKDQSVHTRSCHHCTCVGDVAHTLGALTWNWANDYSSASAATVCTDCGRELSFNAAVTTTSDNGYIIHTASFTYNGTVYTDEAREYADSIGARVVGHSVSLDGDIGVNFYMELSDDIANSDTAYIQFEIPRTGDPEIKTVSVKGARKVSSGDKTYYAFKCQVAAKEMTSDVKARIIDGDRSGNIYTYSVKDYANYLLSHADANGTDQEKAFAKASELVRKMLNYGAYSQLYFDKNTGKLANEGLSADDKELGEVEINIADPVLEALPDGVTFEGASLSLKSETTLSLYFMSSQTLSFSCDDYTVETTRSGGYQIARIRGIRAVSIGDIITLNVNDAPVQYSPLNYCKSVLDGETYDPELKNVVKAVYRYWYAASRYFKSTSLTPAN